MAYQQFEQKQLSSTADVNKIISRNPLKQPYLIERGLFKLLQETTLLTRCEQVISDQLQPWLRCSYSQKNITSAPSGTTIAIMAMLEFEKIHFIHWATLSKLYPSRRVKIILFMSLLLKKYYSLYLIIEQLKYLHFCRIVKQLKYLHFFFVITINNKQTS